MAKRKRPSITEEVVKGRVRNLKEQVNDRYPILKSTIAIAFNSMMVAVREGYVDEAFAEKVNNNLTYFINALQAEPIDPLVVGGFAKFFHDAYKELKTNKEIQRHWSTNYVKVLLENMKELDEIMLNTVKAIDGNFSYADQRLKKDLVKKITDSQNEYETVSRIQAEERSRERIPMMEEVPVETAYQHVLREIVVACGILVKVADSDKIDPEKIREVEIRIHEVNQALDLMKPSRLTESEMVPQATQQDIDRAIKSYNNFVKKQTAAMIGKQLLFAIKAVGAAAMTAFTLTYGLGKAKEIYKSAKHEAKMHRDVNKQMHMFKPKKPERSNGFKLRKHKGPETL